MKTVELKLSLRRSQQQTINEWLSALKYPWNKGVELIKRFNEFNYYDKRYKAIAPCCPISSYNHKIRESFPSFPIGWELDGYSGFVQDTSDHQLIQTLVDEGKPIERLVTVRQPYGIFLPVLATKESW